MLVCAEKEKRPNPVWAKSLIFHLIFGRGGGIRTRDPLHPMQVRYQAAPRPDELRIIAEAVRRDYPPP